jgi:hypothetical protein
MTKISTEPEESPTSQHLAKRVIQMANIPCVLFHELSWLFGQGEEQSLILYHGKPLHCRTLGPKERLLGFDGAIGYREDDPMRSIFMVWNQMPTWEEDSWQNLKDPRPPLLRIFAHPHAGDGWQAGQAELITKISRTHVTRDSVYEHDLLHPASPFIGLVIMRAHQLAQESPGPGAAFWDKHL